MLLATFTFIVKRMWVFHVSICFLISGFFPLFFPLIWLIVTVSPKLTNLILLFLPTSFHAFQPSKNRFPIWENIVCWTRRKGKQNKRYTQCYHNYAKLWLGSPQSRLQDRMKCTMIRLREMPVGKGGEVGDLRELSDHKTSLVPSDKSRK